MESTSKGLGSTKHGKSGKSVNIKHFTGTKGGKRVRRKNPNNLNKKQRREKIKDAKKRDKNKYRDKVGKLK